ncbi:MAG: sensor histidine kinase, partial [Deltaproteobacteria bacterium]|nr:sensor histidine kinase [Deltaproteobacteria bacterium]
VGAGGYGWRSWGGGLLSAAFAFAAPPVLSESPALALTQQQDVYSLAGFLEVLEDPSGQWTVEQAASPEFNHGFRALPGDTFFTGIRDSVHWIRFSLNNQSENRRDWGVALDDPRVDAFDFFLLLPPEKTGGGPHLAKKISGGSDFPFATRPIVHRDVVIPIHLEPGEVGWVYLRIKAGMAHIPIRVFSQTGFSRNSIEEYLGFGIYYGCMLVMLFYNLLLYITLREKSYLYYAMMMVGLVGWVSVVNGMATQFLWPNHPWFYHPAYVVLLLTTTALILQFSREFLKVAFISFHLDRVLVWAMGGLLGMIPAVLFLGEMGSKLGAGLASLTAMILLFWAAWIARTHQRKNNRYFLLSMSILSAGVGVFYADILGLVPQDWLIENSLELGSMGQVLVISLVLAEKYNTTLKEKESAQELMVDSLRTEYRLKTDYSLDLERQVALRTFEVQTALENAQAANSSKERLFSIIAHDIKNPLTAMLVTSDLLEKEAQGMTREEVSEFAGRINRTTHNLYRMLENLLHWALSQMGKLEVHPESFEIAASLETELKVLSELAAKKDIWMHQDIPPGVRVLGDIQMINTVTRNLLTNAIKFTPAKGEITIYSREKEDMVEISIHDSGMGIPAEELASLFSDSRETLTRPGTANEKGTGIGLVMCKDLVEMNGGNIWAESLPGEGSTFTFSLPKPR